MNNKTGKQQITICRNEYIRLAREVAKKGISRDAIETCRTTLVDYQEGKWFLKPTAFLPTGVAMGCPLPQLHLQKLFYRSAELIEKWIRGVDDPTLPVFAYVPPQSYHITIVNRSHYEFNAVVPLTIDERDKVESVVSKLRIKQVTVATSGFFLTHTGRLFVKCLVLDDAILKLRTTISETYPQFRINIPRLIHIKIGHLMKGLNKQELLEFTVWLERLGHYSISRIDFTDLYTPAGRIEF
jgi:hypothetical protein